MATTKVANGTHEGFVVITFAGLAGCNFSTASRQPASGSGCDGYRQQGSSPPMVNDEERPRIPMTQKRCTRPRLPRWAIVTLQSIGVLLAVAIFALVMFAVLPVSTHGLEPQPRPAATYAEAEAALAGIARAETQARIKPECRTRLLGPARRTEQVIVLYHGLTNCPRQMLDLGRQLAQTKANVLVMRIPGHGISGGTVHDLSGLDAEAIRDTTDQGLDIARGLGAQTTVVGMSLGGNMAAWAAQERTDVYRAVLIAPALVLGNVSRPVANVFRNTFTRLPPLVIPGTGVQRESHTYPDATPLRPSAETFRFGTRVLREAAGRAPQADELAILENASDRTISNEAISELVSDWRTQGAQVREVVLPASLGLPHDVMDHTQDDAKPGIVDPIVVALATGAPLPSPLPPGTRVSDR